MWSFPKSTYTSQTTYVTVTFIKKEHPAISPGAPKAFLYSNFLLSEKFQKYTPAILIVAVSKSGKERKGKWPYTACKKRNEKISHAS